MTKWVPTMDFDEQQLEMQPDCDTTFGYYGRNIMGLPTASSNGNEEMYVPTENEVLMKPEEYNLVRKIKSEIHGDAIVGRRLTVEELEDTDTRELEIVSMIRKAGMGPSVDEGLSSTRTIPAIESEEPHTRRNFPVLYDDSYFKLRPKKPLSKSPSSSCASGESSFTENKKISDIQNRSSPVKSKTEKNVTHSVVSQPVEGSSSHNAGKVKQRLSPSKKGDKTKPSSSVVIDNCQHGAAHTEVNPTILKKKSKCKIAANFDKKSLQLTRNPASENRIEKERNSLNFVTPAELYRKKRKSTEKSPTKI